MTDFKTGDQLELTQTLDANGDGLVDGTSIRIVEASATRFVLSGTGTIEQYEQALNSLRIDNETDPQAGDAPTPRWSSPMWTATTARRPRSRSSIANTIAGTAGNDSSDRHRRHRRAVRAATATTSMRGGGGRDFLDGGDGNDTWMAAATTTSWSAALARTR